jgi:alcohol dehydrogenase class IV
VQHEFNTTTRILFGKGTTLQVGAEAAKLGKRALVITGSTPERALSAIDSLRAAGVETTTFSVAGEPTTDLVMAVTEQARNADSDHVVAIGGGSVIDTGKAVAALLTNPGSLMDYLEVIGEGKALLEIPAPCVAIPTTAGTGAEVTKNAVLGSTVHKVKVSMRHPELAPNLAIVDPQLTWTMSQSLTASTGLDALTQLLEVFVSNRANALTDAFCQEGLLRAARSLDVAWEDGDNEEAREDMAVASLFGGLALANAKLGAVHGFAGPIGGMFNAPHGAVCARLLPYVMEVNAYALKTRKKKAPALERYEKVATILTGDPIASITDVIDWIEDLCDDLQIPPLKEYGMGESDFTDIVEKAKRSSSMQGNPIELTDEELLEILAKAHAEE